MGPSVTTACTSGRSTSLLCDVVFQFLHEVVELLAEVGRVMTGGAVDLVFDVERARCVACQFERLHVRVRRVGDEVVPHRLVAQRLADVVGVRATHLHAAGGHGTEDAVVWGIAVDDAVHVDPAHAVDECDADRLDFRERRVGNADGRPVVEVVAFGGRHHLV